MKRRVIKHDLEFVVALAVLAGLFAVLGTFEMSKLFSTSLVATLFFGYLTYTGYKLTKIQ